MATGNPTTIVDDKSPICIPFILSRLREERPSFFSTAPGPSPADANEGGGGRQQQQQPEPEPPFIVGLNGVQGVGKTTLVRALAARLREDEGLETLVCSIDDFYLTHADQRALAAAHPDNPLVQVRGEPGTHDMELARSFFAALRRGEEARVPRYDKSLHGGAGDRVLPESLWEVVNGPGRRRVQVVIVEGWCVGFRALGAAAEVEARWRGAGTRTLASHRLEDLLLVNERLRAYDAALTDHLDAFVHVDAEDTAWVYDWRLEQEVRLREDTGSGMSDDQVVRFVDAYYPAYELFSDKLRAGLFPPDKPGRQLRLVVGKDRRVIRSEVI